MATNQNATADITYREEDIQYFIEQINKTGRYDILPRSDFNQFGTPTPVKVCRQRSSTPASQFGNLAGSRPPYPVQPSHGDSLLNTGTPVMPAPHANPFGHPPVLENFSGGGDGSSAAAYPPGTSAQSGYQSGRQPVHETFSGGGDGSSANAFLHGVSAQSGYPVGPPPGNEPYGNPSGRPPVFENFSGGRDVSSANAVQPVASVQGANPVGPPPGFETFSGGPVPPRSIPSQSANPIQSVTFAQGDNSTSHTPARSSFSGGPVFGGNIDVPLAQTVQSGVYAQYPTQTVPTPSFGNFPSGPVPVGGTDSSRRYHGNPGTPAVSSIHPGNYQQTSNYQFATPTPTQQTSAYLTGFLSSRIPSLPPFSGEGRSDDSEFEMWKNDVYSYLRDGVFPEYAVLESVRRSLRGTARSVFLRLGDSASLQEIVQDLEGIYGNVSSSEHAKKMFYNACQQSGETIGKYSVRLETLLRQANLQISDQERNSMLCNKLWSGLQNTYLKHITRHKYEEIQDFRKLRVQLRAVEEEINLDSSKTTLQASQGMTLVESQLLKQLDSLTAQMRTLQSRLSAFENTETATTADSALNSVSSGASEASGRGSQRGTRGWRGRGRGNRGRGGERVVEGLNEPLNQNWPPQKGQ